MTTKNIYQCFTWDYAVNCDKQARLVTFKATVTAIEPEYPPFTPTDLQNYHQMLKEWQGFGATFHEAFADSKPRIFNKGKMDTELPREGTVTIFEDTLCLLPDDDFEAIQKDVEKAREYIKEILAVLVEAREEAVATAS